MGKTLKGIFENLEGCWRLRREIYHLDARSKDPATGVAIFFSSNEPDTLFYEERGVLEGKNIKFSRKYIYQLHEKYIDIILNDGVTQGQLFQTITLQDNQMDCIGSEHICKLDRHNGKHIFHNDSTFYTEYTVKGPKADLKIRTHYEKINVEGGKHAITSIK